MGASLRVWQGTDPDQPIDYDWLGTRIADMIWAEMKEDPNVVVLVRIFPGNMIDIRVEREEIPAELDYSKQ